MTDHNLWIGPIDEGHPLVLERAPNGGWTVSAQSLSPGMMSETLGAFTSTQDLLAALRHSLLGEAQ